MLPTPTRAAVKEVPTGSRTDRRVACKSLQKHESIRFAQPPKGCAAQLVRRRSGQQLLARASDGTMGSWLLQPADWLGTRHRKTEAVLSPHLPCGG